MTKRHVGEYLKDELNKRNWSQTEFSEIICKPLKTINQIINGKSGISPQMAYLFGEAFDQNPALWLTRQSKYQLDKVRSKQ